MDSESEMMQDLQAADAAGDTELAQHIAGKIKASRAPSVGAPEAALRGATQGATLGFGDEMEAGWKSLFPKSMGGGAYKATRDQLRADEANARTQHPYVYGGTEIGGSLLPGAVMAAATGGTSLAPTMAKLALPAAAGQGTVQGAGYSNATTAGGLVRDAGLGTGLGVLGYGLGSALGGVGRKLAGSARGLAVRANARAADMAAKEVAEGIGSAKGALGAEVQKGSRYVENLMRLEQSMTPEQKALYASLHPELEKLQQRVAQSTLDALPEQAGTIATKDAELAALKSGASQAFHARKDELLQPQFLKDTLSLAKSYGEPLAAAALAPAGLKIPAAVLFGRTRAGKAIANRLTRPGNQKAAAEFLENRVTGPTATFLRKALQVGLPTAETQQLVTQ